MCDCQSYNRPDLGGTSRAPAIRCDVDLLVPEDERPLVCVDECIIPQIRALWAHGVETKHSCCGHNRMVPDVGVAHAEAIPLAVQILRRSDSRTWRVWAYT